MHADQDARLTRMRTLAPGEDAPVLRVGRLALVGASEIFAVLRTPSLHADFDPKHMIRSVDAASADPICRVGDTFTMNMYAERLGEYRMVNTVTEFVPDRVIAWMPAQEGYRPLGFRWRWSLDPRGADSTYITLTYDWLEVTHETFLARNTFPMFPRESFDASVDALVRLVEADWGDDEDALLAQA